MGLSLRAFQQQNRVPHRATRSRLHRSAPVVFALATLVAAAHLGARAHQAAEARRYPAGYHQALSAFGPDMRYLATPSHARFQGNPTLVVGDSMVHQWFWRVDKVSLWGHATPAIRSEFERLAAERSYTQIVLWAGTAHALSRRPVEEYVEDTAAMVRFARARSQDLVLIAPLTPEAVRSAADEGVRRIRAQFPDLPIIDLSTWRETAEARGDWKQWSDDGIHLNSVGREHLLDELARTNRFPALTLARAPRVASSHSTGEPTST